VLNLPTKDETNAMRNRLVSAIDEFNSDNEEFRVGFM